VVTQAKAGGGRFDGIEQARLFPGDFAVQLQLVFFHDFTKIL
jgi:hypothetical protein